MYIKRIQLKPIDMEGLTADSICLYSIFFFVADLLVQEDVA